MISALHPRTLARTLQIRQLEKTQLASFLIEKKINVGVVHGLVARGGTEQIKTVDASLL
jgi:hypothetical protein